MSTPCISIITPTLGSIEKLSPLLASLRSQIDAPPFELLLCVTETYPGAQDHLRSIFSDFNGAPIRFISSPEKCISAARNKGLEQAHGRLVLFLDDDCHLPDPDYLRHLDDAYKANHQLVGGGYYLNEPGNKNFSSCFYNLLCNVWINAHKNNDSSPRVLLGGCCFYAKNILLKHGLKFEALNKKAGEEYAFNHNIAACGYALTLHERWSVYHNPRSHLLDVFRKAWTQGKSMDQKKQAPSFVQPLWQALKEQPTRLAYLPLFALYYMAGRWAYWNQYSEPPKNHSDAVGQVSAHQVDPQPPRELPALYP